MKLFTEVRITADNLIQFFRMFHCIGTEFNWSNTYNNL